MKKQQGWTNNLQVESASCSSHVIAGGRKMINENRNSPSTAGGEITFTGTHHHGRLSVTILKMLFIWPLVFCFTAEQRWRVWQPTGCPGGALISVIHQKMVIRAMLYEKEWSSHRHSESLARKHNEIRAARRKNLNRSGHRHTRRPVESR
jgi:hypothetical protein